MTSLKVCAAPKIWSKYTTPNVKSVKEPVHFFLKVWNELNRLYLNETNNVGRTMLFYYWRKNISLESNNPTLRTLQKSLLNCEEKRLKDQYWSQFWQMLDSLFFFRKKIELCRCWDGANYWRNFSPIQKYSKTNHHCCEERQSLKRTKQPLKNPL